MKGRSVAASNARIMKTNDKRTRMSRRQALGLLAAGGCGTLLSACGLLSEPAGGKSSQGYSIFRETMADMPWPEIKQAAQDGAVVLLPVGIIEEHGPHLGLGVDTYSVTNWCQMLRPVLQARGIPALIAPPVYWGISPEVGEYPGTFSVQPDTLYAILYDIHASLHQWGFRYVFSFNAHGDTVHKRVFQQALSDVNTKIGIGAYYVCAESAYVTTSDFVLYQKPVAVPESFQNHLDIHAGAFETAEMLAYFPEIVNTKIAKTLPPSDSFDPLGYWGDPASYDQIKLDEVRKWAGDLVASSADAIEEFLKSQNG